MRVSAINHCDYQVKQRRAIHNNLSHQAVDSVAFQGKAGKIVGGALGGVAGGAAGGAIIGGGTLAGAALVAASGPIGWGLAALYTVGGAIVGGWLGSEVGDIATEKKDKT